MTEPPAAEFHAETVGVHMTSDGAFAMLTLLNNAQTFTVTLPRQKLEGLGDRIRVVLSA